MQVDAGGLRRQRELAGHVLAPVEAVFDLLEGTGQMLHRQAEALEAAGDALRDAAGLVKAHAAAMQQTLAAVRTPAEVARRVAGLEPRRPKEP